MTASRKSSLCPETCFVFVSYGRHEVAAASWESLRRALEPWRDRVKLIIADATDDDDKIAWARGVDADDVILTPRFTPAATSRNLALTLIHDKYSTEFLALLEDDFEYDHDWYPTLRETARRLFGVVSPWGLAYGMFSGCDRDIPVERLRDDPAHGVKAYLFGAVAYQRFVPAAHYHSVMRMWDPDVLGISCAQTGGQTFRHTMRGFCGAITGQPTSRPIITEADSTWRAGKRDPGPPAHSFDLDRYAVVRDAARQAGDYALDAPQS